jgi:hypothetical protein
MPRLAGRLPFRIRRTRSDAYPCSYEEGKFFPYAGTCPLGRPATPRAAGCCGGSTALGIEWFGGGAHREFARHGWPAVPPGAGSAWRRMTAGHPPVRLDRDRQPYAKAAGHASTERNGGFVPRYYSATHIWASTTTTGTPLPHRVSIKTLAHKFGLLRRRWLFRYRSRCC